MIRHVVLWKLKDFAEGNNKFTNAKLMKEKLETLAHTIPQVKSLIVSLDGRNTLPDNWDIMLDSTFENTQDVLLYQNHPEHLKAVEFIRNIRDLKASVDYEEKTQQLK